MCDFDDDAWALSIHMEMVKAKVSKLSSKERDVLFKHYFDDRTKGIPKRDVIADLAEALMFDPKSPLFFED